VVPPRLPTTPLIPIVVVDRASLALLLKVVPPTLLLLSPIVFFPDKSIFFCLVELPSNECNPGINDILTYYTCLLSLSLSLNSLSLSLSFSLSKGVVA
jgi:hypothetical protein